MKEALKKHWPEYLMEAWGLGTFMVSASLIATLLEYPGSPVHQALPNPFVRFVLTGLAMGLTNIAIIYSPWGQQSGAHLNPAVTFTFWRLGKVKGWDATFYMISQFAGGVTGVALMVLLLGQAFASPPVHYAATVPHTLNGLAFAAEFSISFILMTAILWATNSKSWAPYTGLMAGLMVALFITFEAPLSGMSMNPARSFASAFPGHIWNAFWIYMLAPPLAMLLASEVYIRMRRGHQVFCAKLNHQTSKRCIFNCGYYQKT